MKIWNIGRNASAPEVQLRVVEKSPTLINPSHFFLDENPGESLSPDWAVFCNLNAAQEALLVCRACLSRRTR
jgi:hypothetical protein